MCVCCPPSLTPCLCIGFLIFGALFERTLLPEAGSRGFQARIADERIANRFCVVSIDQSVLRMVVAAAHAPDHPNVNGSATDAVADLVRAHERLAPIVIHSTSLAMRSIAVK